LRGLAASGSHGSKHYLLAGRGRAVARLEETPVETVDDAWAQATKVVLGECIERIVVAIATPIAILMRK
jgi:hypothetical protein